MEYDFFSLILETIRINENIKLNFSMHNLMSYKS
jgi:hypothetical protein